MGQESTFSLRENRPWGKSQGCSELVSREAVERGSSHEAWGTAQSETGPPSLLTPTGRGAPHRPCRDTPIASLLLLPYPGTHPPPAS